jgi:hypothetical protein
MKRLTLTFVLAVVAALAASPSFAEKKPQPLTLSLSSQMVAEPAQVSVHMRVEPDTRSRSLLVQWWTLDGVGGSSLIELDGERAAVRHTYPIRRMEAGEYMVTAVLIRNDGSQVRKQLMMTVVPNGSRFQDVRIGSGAD